MPRLLVYVMRRDTGKAPEVKGNICILEKCKSKNIVKSAKIGDWIVGIGGKMLLKGKYDRKMIYAMKVESEKPPTSRYFTHYGDKAIPLDDFNEITRVKRTKYIRGPELYHDFDKFMDSQPRGKIGSFCCNVSRTGCRLSAVVGCRPACA